MKSCAVFAASRRKTTIIFQTKVDKKEYKDLKNAHIARVKRGQSLEAHPWQPQ